MAGDPPTVASCTPLENDQPRALPARPQTGVDAFLDGVQRSRVVGYASGSPIVFATVAAAVRERHDKQLSTWREPRVRHLLLSDREAIGAAAWRALEDTGVALIDLAEAAGTFAHPLAARARALECVSEERETLERRLAAEWCRDESRWLWIDGGISGNLAVDDASTAFGVVKSHTTLYGDAAALRTVLALRVGERGPLFMVQHRARRGVASWYMRVHDAPDGDPLHGLVRVEVAPPPRVFGSAPSPDAPPDPAVVAQLAARADQLSEWILADRAPIALPDPRWPALSYGVYACEQFLKALIGS